MNDEDFLTEQEQAELERKAHNQLISDMLAIETTIAEFDEHALDEALAKISATIDDEIAEALLDAGCLDLPEIEFFDDDSDE